MKTTIGHIGLNLSNNTKSFTFWKDLLNYLGLSFLEETASYFDAKDSKGSYICVSATEKKYKTDGFHRKRTGLNHIAFKVNSKKAVDQFVKEFLEPRKIKALYGGAKAYPEYIPDYYAVYFEDPDRIKVEVVYEK